MLKRHDDRNKARKELLAAILERSVSDVAFRSGLLADPKRTIRETFGIRIPEHVRIRFIEKSSDVDTLIVLPNRPDLVGELDGAALDVVNGGHDDAPSGDPDELWFDLDSAW